MAWDVTAYGITLAVLAIAAACVLGIVQCCRSLARIAASVERLSREAETALTECRKLADEAGAAVRAGRHSLKGFASLAEGARVLGEAAHTAAQSVSQVTAIWRDRVASPIAAASDRQEQSGCRQQEWMQIGSTLWQLWKRRAGDREQADCVTNSGRSADPSLGE